MNSKHTFPIMEKEFIDYIPIALIELNQSASIIHCNPQVENVFGYDPNELCGINLSRIIPESTNIDFWNVLKKHYSENNVYNFGSGIVIKGLQKSGREIEIDFALNRIPFGDNTHLIAIFRIITTCNWNEESQFLAQASVDRSADTIVWLDRNAKLIYVNNSACETLGYSREELLKMTIHDIDVDFPPEAWAPHVEYIRKVGSLCFESRHKSKNGNIIPVEVTCNYFEHDGNFYSFAFNRNISERKKNEEILKLTQYSVDRAAENIIWLDENANIIYVNDASCTSLGYSREELLKMKIHSIDPDFPAEAWRPHIEDLKKRKAITFESRHRTKDGRVFPVEVTGNYIEYNGRYYSFAFDRDISERKRVEKELELHRENLEKLVEKRTSDLKKAMEQLVQSEKLAALGQLVAGFAHELNTPLGNTRMMASALKEEVLKFSEAVQGGVLTKSYLDSYLQRSLEAIKLLENNASRASELISKFKQVAVDQASTRKRKFHLKTTLEELISTLQPQFKHTNHKVILEIPPDIELDSYPGPLGQVIANLIGNSLLHGFKNGFNGEIRIRAVKTDSEKVRIEYSDNGSGIPDGIRNRIFEPFFTTKLGQGGSGLGMYIVYNLISSVLDGNISINPELTKGIGFIITLPLQSFDKKVGFI